MSEEQREILSRFHGLELKVEAILSAQKSDKEIREAGIKISKLIHEDLTKITTRHEEIFNGTAESVGMVTRVAQVEKTEKSRTWNLRALWLGFISVFGVVFAAIITNAMF